jgi:hypothetical protein
VRVTAKTCQVCEGIRDVFDGERWESCWACDGTGEESEGSLEEMKAVEAILEKRPEKEST